jgi:hypothetical protein
MKKAIELIKHVIKVLRLSHSHTHQICIEILELAVDALEHPCWETPEQYEKRTGEPWPDKWAVYRRKNYPNTGWTSWEVLSYGWARFCVWQYQIICATEAGPPPDDWEPDPEAEK